VVGVSADMHRPSAVVDLLAQHSEDELIGLKLRLQKQLARLEFEIEQFDKALAQKQAAKATGDVEPSPRDGGQPTEARGSSD
jgi:hypothetical protein